MKICTKCKIEKSDDCFSFKSKKRNIKKPSCKVCDKLIANAYYIENKVKIVKKSTKRNIQIKIRNYTYVINYLKNNPCIDCGEPDPIVLEFDHRDGVKKVMDISKMCNWGCDINTIQSEIDKCDVRCSNCHKRRTAKQKNWFQYMNF